MADNVAKLMASLRAIRVSGRIPYAKDSLAKIPIVPHKADAVAIEA